MADHLHPKGLYSLGERRDLSQWIPVTGWFSFTGRPFVFLKDVVQLPKTKMKEAVLHTLPVSASFSFITLSVFTHFRGVLSFETRIK